MGCLTGWGAIFTRGLGVGRSHGFPCEKILKWSLGLIFDLDFSINYDMSKKRPKNGQKWHRLRAIAIKQSQNQEQAVPKATWLNTEFRGHLVHLQPPTLIFVVSKAHNRPRRRLDPCTSGHLVDNEGSPGRARWGPMVDPPGSLGRKKHFFQSCSKTT